MRSPRAPPREKGCGHPQTGERPAPSAGRARSRLTRSETKRRRPRGIRTRCTSHGAGGHRSSGDGPSRRALAEWARMGGRWTGWARARADRPHSGSGGRPIVSFRIRYGGQWLHHNYVVALLNDPFGIGSRGGCSCAGPYGHRLLAIDPARSLALPQLLLVRASDPSQKCLAQPPGFERTSANSDLGKRHRLRGSRRTRATGHL